MKFTHEEKVTPTFRQWCRTATPVSGSRFDIIRIFANDEWRNITLCTEEFRINVKHASKESFDKAYKELSKLLRNHVRAYVEYTSGTSAEITIIPASDADDNPSKFTPDELGWIRS
jgi:hypothetical protein